MLKNLSGPKTLMIVLGCLLLMVAAIAEYRFLGLSPVEKMSGTYTGDYADGRETMHLNRDGTFTQRFVSDGKTVYTNRGRWEIKGEILDFYNLMMPLNVMAPLIKGSGVTRYPIFSCQVDPNDRVIIFDQGIYIKK